MLKYCKGCKQTKEFNTEFKQCDSCIQRARDRRKIEKDNLTENDICFNKQCKYKKSKADLDKLDLGKLKKNEITFLNDYCIKHYKELQERIDKINNIRRCNEHGCHNGHNNLANDITNEPEHIKRCLECRTKRNEKNLITKINSLLLYTNDIKEYHEHYKKLIKIKLSIDEFKDYCNSKCFYCGEYPDDNLNGIDINDKITYTTICNECFKMKGNFTKNIFILKSINLCCKLFEKSFFEKDYYFEYPKYYDETDYNVMKKDYDENEFIRKLSLIYSKHVLKHKKYILN